MILITVARTLFYQMFLLFIGISIGFICNAEWVGWKSCLVERSVKNIFFPIEFNDNTCQAVKNWGQLKLWGLYKQPANFKILEDGLLGEEFYVAKISYTDENGRTVEKIDSVRVRWKTWEYYYTDPEPWDIEDIEDYIENGTLNSHESDKAFKLYQEKQLQERAKIKT